MKTLRDLNKGESGIIKDLKESEITTKLLDMGCLPGEEVLLKYIAPLGDPICISINGYELVLRNNEASTIIIQ